MLYIKKQVGPFKEFDTNDGIHNFFNISFNRQGVPRNISKKTSDKIDTAQKIQTEIGFFSDYCFKSMYVIRRYKNNMYVKVG